MGMLKHDHDHQHFSGEDGREIPPTSGRKIFWVTVLNAVITGTEVAGGLLSAAWRCCRTLCITSVIP